MADVPLGGRLGWTEGLIVNQATLHSFDDSGPINLRTLVLARVTVQSGPFTALMHAVAPTLQTLDLVDMRSPKPDGQEFAVLLFETVIKFRCLSSVSLCDNVEVGIGEWAITSMLTERLHHCTIETTRCGILGSPILPALRKCSELETLRCVFDLGSGMMRRTDDEESWTTVLDAIAWLDGLTALSLADPAPTRQRMFVPCDVDALIARLPRQLLALDWAIWPLGRSHMKRLAERCPRLIELSLFYNPSEVRMVRELGVACER